MAAGKNKKDFDPSSASGIWITASYMNHACDGNARRSFIGDMMIVRATKTIKRHAEIFMPYHPASEDHDVTRAALQKSWKFICECAMCLAEQKGTKLQHNQRAAPVVDAKSFLESHALSKYTTATSATIKQAKSIITKLEKTYGEELSKPSPRICLGRIRFWLCTATCMSGPLHQTISMAFETLKDFGYLINATGDKVNIDRTHCCLEINAVDAAVYAAHAYLRQGNMVGKQLLLFAEEMYQTTFGELRGFDKRYGVGLA